MTSRLLIAGVAAGCVAAAGVGGFLAVRTATYSSEASSSAETVSTTMAPAEVAAPAPAALVAAPADPPRLVADAAPTRRSRTAPTAVRPIEAPETAPEASAPSPPVDASAPTLELSVPASQSATIPVHPGRRIELPEPRAALNFVELPANAVVGIQLETTVSSDSARVEEVVRARVTRPVIVDGVTVIPSGALVTGAVTLVEPGGRFRERARIGVRFTSVVTDSQGSIPIRTESIYRVGEAPTGEATAKIGASAVVGSIIGGVFGGRKGAAIGAATGAAGGTAVVAAGGPNVATLASGASLTVRLSEPAVFEVER
jgi:hypothetical protein